MLQAEMPVGVAPERALEPGPHVTQQLGEVAATTELSGAEQVAAVLDGTTSAPEVPASHPDFDPQTMTVSGLIKACPHYARMAETNPELAKAKATEVVERVQERQTMRENGMSDEAVKKQQWSSMHQRLKERTKAEEKPTEYKQPKVPEPTNIEHHVAAMASAGRIHEAPEPVTVPPPAAHKEPARPVAKDNAGVSIPTVAPVVHGHEQRARLQIVRAYEAVRPGAPRVAETVAVAEGQLVIPPTVRHEAWDMHVERVALHETLLPDDVLEPPTAATSAVEVIRAIETPALAEAADLSAEVFTMQELLALPPFDSLQAAGPNEPSDPELAAVIPLPVAANENIGLAVPSEIMESVTWSEELDNEPLVLFEDFTEALHTLIATAETESSTGELTTTEPIDTQLMDTEPMLEALLALEPVPAVATVVAERLDELATEEKEAVASVLQDVITAAQAIAVLETEIAEPEVIEAAEAQLEAYVIALFEWLGVIYEPEDVELFMQVLFRPDFQPPQPGPLEAVIEVDLEHDGTHEAVIHLPRAAAALLAADDDEQRNVTPMLGSFVLLRYAVGQAV